VGGQRPILAPCIKIWRGIRPPCPTACCTPDGDDIDDSRLHLHLSMLGDLWRFGRKTSHTHSDWHRRRRTAVYGQCRLVTVVARSRQLAVSIPNFEPTTERNFSYLRRLKTFLHSTVTKKRLNHTAILHCHREQYVNLEAIFNSFIVKNELRQSTFAMFPISQ